MVAKNILHAEDEPDDVAMFKRAVERGGLPHAVRWVDNGEAAIDWLSGKGEYADRNRFPVPDLLMLDLKMPKKSGFDVLQWARESAEFQKLPVIILSSSDDPKDVQRVREFGGTTYFLKTASYRDVVEHLRKLT